MSGWYHKSISNIQNDLQNFCMGKTSGMLLLDFYRNSYNWPRVQKH